ncbi:uncharacterized protein [Rutidosis leptorrhynchoides]|uniref:uncharacterized protein n=1 Tax=Rutidosis leptorrhynchoides TaxID=125765 RepID=UPI003A98EE48
MGGRQESISPPPEVAVAPPLLRGDHWTHFDNSVNAVSFGFVATAILISMFLVMAIFERFLRPRSTVYNVEDTTKDFVVHRVFSVWMTVYAKGVSVLMPGEEIPTFLAIPTPATANTRTELKCNSSPILPSSNSSPT